MALTSCESTSSCPTSLISTAMRREPLRDPSKGEEGICRDLGGAEGGLEGENTVIRLKRGEGEGEGRCQAAHEGAGEGVGVGAGRGPQA